MTGHRPLRAWLARPVPVAAVAVLLVNDHFLKSAWPSWVTGKLSDVAGLAFFPLLLGALVESVAPASRAAPRRLLAVCVAATAVVFTAVQMSPAVGDAYRWVWGAMQWPLRAALDPGVRLAPVAHSPDPSDLLALPALLVSWRMAATRPTRGSGSEKRTARGGVFGLPILPGDDGTDSGNAATS